MRKVVQSCLSRQHALIKAAYRITASSLGKPKQKHFIVFDDLGLAYLNVPKSACSTVKYHLLKNSIGEGADEYIGRLSKYNWSVCRDRTKLNPTLTTFTIVRNPYSRILSMYKDKFLGAHKSNKKFHFTEYLGGIFHQNMSFEEVIDEICDIPDNLADDHFRSQYDICYDKGERVVEHLWKLEDLNEKAGEIHEVTGLMLADRLNKSSSASLSSHFSESVVEKIKRRYRNDFEAFGYDVSLPD